MHALTTGTYHYSIEVTVCSVVGGKLYSEVVKGEQSSYGDMLTNHRLLGQCDIIT
jgi:hypothetical protein